MNVSVLGCGRWGSFLAWYCNKLGYKVTSYGPEGDYSYEILKKTGRNEYVVYNDKINISCDLEESVRTAEIIIISISSQGLRGFVKKITQFDLTGKTFILCMKGIEETTGKRLSEVAIEGGIDKNSVAVWVGPGHIQEFVKNVPNCMVIDSYSQALTIRLADTFKSSLIRFYYGNDIIGTEVGAAAKNIMGIVAGALDGLNYSTLKGPLMARGAREVSRLIKALGGDEFSAYGLCHLGDYETTLFSEHSHNRRFGEMFVKNQKFDKLAEGVATARAVAALAARVDVDMPLTDAVNTMIAGIEKPADILSGMFDRDTKHEFYL